MKISVLQYSGLTFDEQIAYLSYIVDVKPIDIL